MSVNTTHQGNGIIYVKIYSHFTLKELETSQAEALELLEADAQTRSVVIMDLTEAIVSIRDLNFATMRRVARRDRDVTEAFVVIGVSPVIRMLTSIVQSVIKLPIEYVETADQAQARARSILALDG